MKVKDLIKELRKYEGGLEVVIPKFYSGYNPVKGVYKDPPGWEEAPPPNSIYLDY